MNGLSAIGANKATEETQELYKYAGEGTLENNMKQLITDEAYSQIAAKFPSLVPIIVGVNIIEMIDESTAIGAAVLGVQGKKLLVPVIYTDGNVDATTFVYSEDEDTILALTKKVAKTISESSSVLEGGPVQEKGTPNYDVGDIHKLFVPPKTFSPKIASGTGGLLFAVLEQSDLLKTALAEKLSDSEYYEEFAKIYGNDAAEYISSAQLSKTASAIDDSPVEVKATRQSIMSSEWLHKEAAMKEFAENGFVISQGEANIKYSLEKVASIGTRLKSIIGDESFSTISGGDMGAYSVYRLSDLKPVDMIISRDINASNGAAPEPIYGPRIDSFMTGTVKGDGVIGKQKNLAEIGDLKSFGSFSGDKGRFTIIFIKDGEVFGHTSLYLDDERIKSGLGRVIFDLPGAKISRVVVEKNSDSNPSIMGSTLYVGDKNVRYFKKEFMESESVVRTSDLDMNVGSNKLIKVAYDGVEYIYKSAAYSAPTLAMELANEGYDKKSIYSLLKTAATEGSAEFAAINAKLDMLGNIVMNLAGQVQQVSSTVQQTAAQGLASAGQPPIIEGQPTQEDAQVEPQEAQLAMQDPNSGMPSPEDEAAMAQQQQEVVAQDQAMLGQQPQPGMEGQQQDISGMNTAVDPEVLRTLSELKDSNIMDVGIISMIAANSELGEVIAQYSGAIHSGASAIGRILLNAMVKKNAIIEQVGEPKYKQMVNSLRTVFTKISDLYVDITRLQLESDGQVAH